MNIKVVRISSPRSTRRFAALTIPCAEEKQQMCAHQSQTSVSDKFVESTFVGRDCGFAFCNSGRNLLEPQRSSV